MAEVKILVAGDPASIHTNRFVSLLQDLGHEVRVFQSEHSYLQEEHLRNTIVYISCFYAPPVNGNLLRITYPREIEYGSLAADVMKYVFRLRFLRRPRAHDLVQVIRRWKPDIVFSLKMQNDGYTVSAAKEHLGNDFKPIWVHFNWGTDIEFFGKHPAYRQEHLPKIRKLLAHCDFHIADCKRDVRQAFEFGLKGVSLGTCPAPGGFDLSNLDEIRAAATGKRDVILVKGREGAVTCKGCNALIALHNSSHMVRSYKIKIIMAQSEVRDAARLLSQLDGMDYEVMPRLPYPELLALYARSRIAISAADVDGTPSFLTEAIAMGAFPVHSDMESVREWVQHGVNGLLFPFDNIKELSACIERSLVDDDLIESARIKNMEISRERLDRNKIKQQIRGLIGSVILKTR